MNILVFLTLILNVISIVLGVLHSQKNGFFRYTLEEQIEKYFVENVPQLTSTVTAFTMVYTFNTVGLIYLLVSLFLPAEKSPVKCSPTLTPTSFFVFYDITFLSSVTWSIVYDKEMMWICYGLQTLATICLWVAAAITFQTVKENMHELKRQSKQMLWLFRILIQNGLCFYGSWAFVTSTIGLSTALIYDNSYGKSKAQLSGYINVEDGSTIGMIVLMAGVIILFVLENFVYEDHFRCIFTTSPVFLLAFTGIAANLHVMQINRNLKLAFLGITISATAFMVKLIFLGLKKGKKHKKEKKQQ